MTLLRDRIKAQSKAAEVRARKLFFVGLYTICATLVLVVLWVWFALSWYRTPSLTFMEHCIARPVLSISIIVLRATGAFVNSYARELGRG